MLNEFTRQKGACIKAYTRWLKYDRDAVRLVYNTNQSRSYLNHLVKSLKGVFVCLRKVEIDAYASLRTEGPRFVTALWKW
jgi:hypothetical protein